MRLLSIFLILSPFLSISQINTSIITSDHLPRYRNYEDTAYKLNVYNEVKNPYQEYLDLGVVSVKGYIRNDQTYGKRYYYRYGSFRKKREPDSLLVSSFMYDSQSNSITAFEGGVGYGSKITFLKLNADGLITLKTQVRLEDFIIPNGNLESLEDFLNLNCFDYAYETTTEYIFTSKGKVITSTQTSTEMMRSWRRFKNTIETHSDTFKRREKKYYPSGNLQKRPYYYGSTEYFYDQNDLIKTVIRVDTGNVLGWENCYLPQKTSSLNRYEHIHSYTRHRNGSLDYEQCIENHDTATKKYIYDENQNLVSVRTFSLGKMIEESQSHTYDLKNRLKRSIFLEERHLCNRCYYQANYSRNPIGSLIKEIQYPDSVTQIVKSINGDLVITDTLVFTDSSLIQLVSKPSKVNAHLNNLAPLKNYQKISPNQIVVTEHANQFKFMNVDKIKYYYILKEIID